MVTAKPVKSLLIILIVVMIKLSGLSVIYMMGEESRIN